MLTQQTWTTGSANASQGRRSHRKRMARTIARYSSEIVSGRMYIRPPSTRSAGSQARTIAQAGQLAASGGDQQEDGQAW